MDKIDNKSIKQLFVNFCCSQCKNDFTQSSFKIIERKKSIYHCRLICEKCGKDFGNIILNINLQNKSHLPLEIIEGAPAINYDDVIDAHEFIKKHL